MSSSKSLTLDRICFVISPIGREGTEIHQKFVEVLDFVIKPAVEQAGYDLKVIRADDIERSGSFIKDILEYISGAYVVIADLTNQNPNVFYELGVRHSLSARTILIAEKLDDIPSDLREYRTIIYDSSAKGAAIFRQRLEKYLKEIHDDPQRPDNPVLDRLGSVIAARTQELEIEVTELRSQLDSVLRKGTSGEKPVSRTKESVPVRLDRILNLIKAQRNHFGRVSVQPTSGMTVEFYLPTRQGNFALYAVERADRTDYLYISRSHGESDLERDLADIRVLMEEVSKHKMMSLTFIIVADEDLSGNNQLTRKTFNKMKTFLKPAAIRRNFSLEIWDRDVLLKKEKDLGIRVELPEVT